MATVIVKVVQVASIVIGAYPIVDKIVIAAQTKGRKNKGNREETF